MNEHFICEIDWTRQSLTLIKIFILCAQILVIKIQQTNGLNYLAHFPTLIG